jgi:hypothetical protein
VREFDQEGEIGPWQADCRPLSACGKRSRGQSPPHATGVPLTILPVGARRAVHAWRFNGKLGERRLAGPTSNQRCPRNGKWTDHPGPAFIHRPLGLCNSLCEPGKAMKVDPPARIPANSVTTVASGIRCRHVQMLAGRPARTHLLVFFS